MGTFREKGCPVAYRVESGITGRRGALGLPVLGGLGWESSRQLLDSTLLRGAETVGKPQSSGGNAGCRGRAAEECPEGAPSHQGEGLWARVALTDGNLKVLIVLLLFP